MSAPVETPPISQGRAVVAPGAFAVRTNSGETGRLPFALAIFVSAFLLFQVQLNLKEQKRTDENCQGKRQPPSFATVCPNRKGPRSNDRAALRDRRRFDRGAHLQSV